MKQCADCGVEKPEAEFYSYKNGRLYLRCKACHYVKCRAYLAADPERFRARERQRYHDGARHIKRTEKLRKKYGLTRAQYDALLERQGHVCPICLQPFADAYSGGEGLHAGSARWDIESVDHCHETGRVRGILHRRCNLALEFMFSPEDLARAEAYLGII